ncbi:MAG: hypothetical protein FWG98_06855 [Candidatus Cloacimonetes bacterium]|nr:hypothetical protein [Candidatus Cloacimonadota bacterium]
MEQQIDYVKRVCEQLESIGNQMIDFANETKKEITQIKESLNGNNN